MNSVLLGLLGISAVTSSAILTDGKENLAYGIANLSNFYPYFSVGVANDTATVAAANNSGLYGSNSTYATTNGSYLADNKAIWEETFNYSSLGSTHKFGEAVIAKNATQYADHCLARIVYDDITLNLSDTLKLSMTVGF